MRARLMLLLLFGSSGQAGSGPTYFDVTIEDA